MRPVALFPCSVSRLSLWCVALVLMLFARASVPSLPSPAPSVFMHLISLMLSNRDVTRLPRHFSLLLLILFYYFFPFFFSYTRPLSRSRATLFFLNTFFYLSSPVSASLSAALSSNSISQPCHVTVVVCRECKITKCNEKHVGNVKVLTFSPFSQQHNFNCIHRRQKQKAVEPAQTSFVLLLYVYWADVNKRQRASERAVVKKSAERRKTLKSNIKKM